MSSKPENSWKPLYSCANFELLELLLFGGRSVAGSERVFRTNTSPLSGFRAVGHHGHQSICPHGSLLLQPNGDVCPGHFQAGLCATCLRCQNVEHPFLYSAHTLILMGVRRNQPSRTCFAYFGRFVISSPPTACWKNMRASIIV
jgi:hypothetical protein